MKGKYARKHLRQQRIDKGYVCTFLETTPVTEPEGGDAIFGGKPKKFRRRHFHCNDVDIERSF